MSRSQFHSINLFILTHAWLNLWDERMTTGRINQVTIRSLTRNCRLATNACERQINYAWSTERSIRSFSSYFEVEMWCDRWNDTRQMYWEFSLPFRVAHLSVAFLRPNRPQLRIKFTRSSSRTGCSNRDFEDSKARWIASNRVKWSRCGLLICTNTFSCRGESYGARFDASKSTERFDARIHCSSGLFRTFAHGVRVQTFLRCWD